MSLACYLLIEEGHCWLFGEEVAAREGKQRIFRAF